MNLYGLISLQSGESNPIIKKVNIKQLKFNFNYSINKKLEGNGLRKERWENKQLPSYTLIFLSMCKMVVDFEILR